MDRPSAGNALFYILMAVALLAALSYTIVQSGRNSAQSLTEEQARLRASEIIDYANTLAQAVTQLRLRGYGEDEISFENSTVSGYINPNCSDGGCKVFHLSGAGVHFNDQYDMAFTGGYVITDVGSSETDLIVDIRVIRETCLAINDLIGVANDGSEGPPNDKMSDGGAFQGMYDLASTAPSNQRTVSSLIGASSGCRHDSGTGESAVFKYYKVLLTR